MMRKITVISCIIVFCLNIVYAYTTKKKSPDRDWLVLVYMSGVNDLGILGYLDKNINAMESVKLTDKVSVVVLYNAIRPGKDKQLLFQKNPVMLNIQYDSDTNKISSPISRSRYDTDMGNWRNLSRFATSSILRFPAKKVMLVIWGKGNGYKGVAYDDVSKHYMSVRQLSLALAGITKRTRRKLDLLAMDASLMQMAGVAWELKDYVKVIVGSEESVPGQGFPYKDVLTDLNKKPEMNAKELAGVLVKGYGNCYSGKGVTVSAVKDYENGKYCGGTTISALDSAAMPGFVKLLNNWTDALTSNDALLKKAAKSSLIENTFYFSSSQADTGVRSLDLCDLIDQINSVLPDGSKAKVAGKTLKKFITENLVISQRAAGTKTGTALPYKKRTRGLAIYMLKMKKDQLYSELQFAKDSHWDSFTGKVWSLRTKEL